MKKALGYIILAILMFSFRSAGASAQEVNELNTWDAPSDYENSTTFQVEVKRSDANQWEALFVYNVKIGEQAVGNKINSSMVNFDFTGRVDVRVTYKKGPIESYDIRPTSLGIEAVQEGNTLSFSMEQDSNMPKKLVIRINDSWDSECLHIVTNQIERDIPSKEADHVYVIAPGDEIPLQLPSGKDTYYFEKGVHNLPKGLWVELDLQRESIVDRFELTQGDFLGIKYAQKFILEGKREKDEPYQVLYDGTANRNLGVIQGNFPSTEVRYIRIRMLGNDSSDGWRFSNSINELRVFEAQTGINVAKEKAVAGAMQNYVKAVDDDITTSFKDKYGYGNAHSEETFFLSADNTTIYMEAGAIVRGAIGAEGINHLKIRGRGILDSGILDHNNVDFGEARTGSIWINDGVDNSIEGITILDPTMWTVVMNYSTNPSVKGINIFGSTMNADGIHMSGSTGGVVDGVFIRTCDDNIVMYHYGHTSNNVIQNSVLWADEAHVFLIGLGTEEDADISNISISNIDVLNQQGVYDLDKFNGVFKIWANGENKISDVRIDNVRIDSFREPSKACILQLRTDERFLGEKNGVIENVSINHIFYNGEGERESVLLGADSVHTIKNVTIDNYYRNGKKIIDFGEANIGKIENTSGLFLEGKEVNPWIGQDRPVQLLTESFDEAQTGEAPDTWTCSEGITVTDFLNQQSKVVRVSKGLGEEAYARKNLEHTKGVITIKAKILLADKNNWKSLEVRDANGQELLQLGFDREGRVYSCEGANYTAFMNYNVNQWYDVQIVIDTDTDRYDLYINDRLMRKHEQLVHNAAEVAGIEFTSGEAEAGVFYFDDVAVVKSFLVLENDFNKEITESMPAGWGTAQGIGVKEFPSGVNKSIKVEKEQGKVVSTGIQIGKQAGVVALEAKIYIENKSNWKSLMVSDVFGKELVQVGFDRGGNIYSYNGTSYVPFLEYAKGQWYEVRLIINTYTDTFDLYIDGNLIIKGASLVNSTTALAKIEFTSSEEPGGVYYFDDVRIVNLF